MKYFETEISFEELKSQLSGSKAPGTAEFISAHQHGDTILYYKTRVRHGYRITRNNTTIANLVTLMASPPRKIPGSAPETSTENPPKAQPPSAIGILLSLFPITCIVFSTAAIILLSKGKSPTAVTILSICAIVKWVSNAIIYEQIRARAEGRPHAPAPNATYWGGISMMTGWATIAYCILSN